MGGHLRHPQAPPPRSRPRQPDPHGRRPQVLVHPQCALLHHPCPPTRPRQARVGICLEPPRHTQRRSVQLSGEEASGWPPRHRGVGCQWSEIRDVTSTLPNGVGTVCVLAP